MPPINHRVEIPCCEIHHLDSDGTIIAGNAYFDRYGILVQRGHAQRPA